MTGAPGESVDAAHWVGNVGGGLMFIVVGLSSLALMVPWWTDNQVTPGSKASVEVSLWFRRTRIELQGDASTLNCAVQCDFTKIGSSKVRESEIPWHDVCEKATDKESTNCTFLWAVRVSTLLCWFCALLYCAFTSLNFCGAGLPNSLRIPPAATIVLGSACLVMCVLSLCIALVMDIRLAAKPPGTQPAVTPEPPGKVKLNGIGFLCTLGSMGLSLLGIGIAYLSQYVFNHLDGMSKAGEPGQGRPLADINRGKAPSNHLVGETIEVRAAPEPAKLGQWMK